MKLTRGYLMGSNSNLLLVGFNPVTPDSLKGLLAATPWKIKIKNAIALVLFSEMEKKYGQQGIKMLFEFIAK
jgi:hypothetical protein